MSTTNDERRSKLCRYLKGIETGAFEDIADLFTPDTTVEQLPNRIYPNGDALAAEVLWTGTLAVASAI